MTDRPSIPIWYELMSADPAAAKTFYDSVADWTIEAQPSGEMDYRMIDTRGGGLVGGVMRLTPEMQTGGAQPGWLFYLGVDDVDATVERVTAEGGGVLMPPWTIEGIGRMALVHDPSGVPFYVMRGASDEQSTAWDPDGLGKGAWCELASADQGAALRFYAAVFGWRHDDKMPMGPMGDYVFVDAGDQRLGAIMPRQSPEQPNRWMFYFKVADVGVAADKVTAGGGQVIMGPMEVPGGQRIVVAIDPAGAGVGFVSGDRPA
jgi:uncharacterized protein